MLGKNLSEQKDIRVTLEISRLSTDQLIQVLEKHGVGDCCDVIVAKQINGDRFLKLNQVQINYWKDLNKSQQLRLWSVVQLANDRPKEFYCKPIINHSAKPNLPSTPKPGFKPPTVKTQLPKPSVESQLSSKKLVPKPPGVISNLNSPSAKSELNSKKPVPKPPGVIPNLNPVSAKSELNSKKPIPKPLGVIPNLYPVSAKSELNSKKPIPKPLGVIPNLNPVSAISELNSKKPVPKPPGVIPNLNSPSAKSELSSKKPVPKPLGVKFPVNASTVKFVPKSPELNPAAKFATNRPIYSKTSTADQDASLSQPIENDEPTINLSTLTKNVSSIYKLKNKQQKSSENNNIPHEKLTKEKISQTTSKSELSTITPNAKRINYTDIDFEKTKALQTRKNENNLEKTNSPSLYSLNDQEDPRNTGNTPSQVRYTVKSGITNRPLPPVPGHLQPPTLTINPSENLPDTNDNLDCNEGKNVRKNSFATIKFPEPPNDIPRRPSASSDKIKISISTDEELEDSDNEDKINEVKGKISQMKLPLPLTGFVKKNSPVNILKPPLNVENLVKTLPDMPALQSPSFVDDEESEYYYDSIHEIKDYKKESWYKDIERQEANGLVEKKPNGTFLIRSSNKHICTLVVKYNKKIYNLAIIKDEFGNLRVGTTQNKRSFRSVYEIVEYYTQNEMPLSYENKDVFIKLRFL